MIAIKSKESYPQGHIALAVANAIFGLNQSATKLVLGDPNISALSLITMRMYAGAILFWFTGLFVGRQRIPAKDVLKLFFASFVGVQLNQYSFVMGMQYTSPIDSSIMATMGPIVTLIAAAIIIKEPLTLKKVSGVALGFIGAMMLIYAGRGSHVSGSNPLLGNLLCLMSAFSYAIYLVVFKDIICRYNPVTIMKWMFLFAAIISSFIGGKQVINIDFSNLPKDIMLELGFVLFCATYLSFLILTTGQRYLRPTIVSMYMYVQPLVSTALSIFLGLDSFSTIKLISASFIFTGVYIVTQSKSRAELELENK